VDLVHDVDLESVAGRPKAHAFLQTPHLVDAVVACPVDLLNVEVVPGGDLEARRTLVAWGGRRGRSSAVRTDAIETPRQQASARSLSNPSDPREQERMCNAPGRDRVGEGVGNVILTNQILEGLGAIFAGEYEVAHAQALTTQLRGRREAPERPSGPTQACDRSSVTSSGIAVKRS